MHIICLRLYNYFLEDYELRRLVRIVQHINRCLADAVLKSAQADKQTHLNQSSVKGIIRLKRSGDKPAELPAPKVAANCERTRLIERYYRIEVHGTRRTLPISLKLLQITSGKIVVKQLRLTLV